MDASERFKCYGIDDFEEWGAARNNDDLSRVLSRQNRTHRERDDKSDASHGDLLHASCERNMTIMGFLRASGHRRGQLLLERSDSETVRG